MWCVPELDEAYMACMEDVLESYERPYDPAQAMICFDEKPVTLHADVRPPTPAAPGREARQDSEYERCGTANVFCAVEPKAGRHFTFVTPDRSGVEFARALFQLALAYPEAETIHLVMDNPSSDRTCRTGDAGHRRNSNHRSGGVLLLPMGCQTRAANLRPRRRLDRRCGTDENVRRGLSPPGFPADLRGRQGGG